MAAIKDGAFDYLPKNFSVDQLTLVVERASRQRRLALENRNLREQLQVTFALENVVGSSPAWPHVFELVKKAARSEANILILGETAPARSWSRAPSIATPARRRTVRAGQLRLVPEKLLESELFGTRRARSRRGPGEAGPGEVADGGTLFLDEIAELPVTLRSRCCARCRSARSGGSAAPRHRRGRARRRGDEPRSGGAVVEGQFREELYYRINVIEMRLPPLRERRRGRASGGPASSRARAETGRGHRRRGGGRAGAYRGPATSASCRTSSSAPAPWPRG